MRERLSQQDFFLRNKRNVWEPRDRQIVWQAPQRNRNSVGLSTSQSLQSTHLRFSSILISLLIFFFLTGLRVLTTHFSLLVTLIDSKTSLYLPRPSLRTSW